MFIIPFQASPSGKIRNDDSCRKQTPQGTIINVYCKVVECTKLSNMMSYMYKNIV